jgi:hypothetical protein
VVPDLEEALRQDVEEETAEELVGRERDGLFAARAERDSALVERDEPPIREADAMRVAPEVAEDLLGSAEGLLRVDDPACAMELVADAREACAICELGGGAVEAELAPVVEAYESGEELPAEEGAEDADGEEEVGTRGDPSLAVERKAAAGHDAVDVRMRVRERETTTAVEVSLDH